MKLDELMKEKEPYGSKFESGNYIINVDKISLDKIKTAKGMMTKLVISANLIKPNNSSGKPINMRFMGVDCGLFFNKQTNAITKKDKKLLHFLLQLSSFNNKEKETYAVEGETLADIIEKIILVNNGFINLSFAATVVKKNIASKGKTVYVFEIPYDKAPHVCVAKSIMSLPEYNPILFEEIKQEVREDFPKAEDKNDDLPF